MSDSAALNGARRLAQDASDKADELVEAGPGQRTLGDNCFLSSSNLEHWRKVPRYVCICL